LLDSEVPWDQNDAMTSASGSIRTPDQRLRVFVSSTLKELAPERRVVRAAIEGLLLAPVMFELGARPHPPRDLYRAYLEQSDVFVGLYGERYGWIAPGEEISGLEDEYRLAPPQMPKLVYIKEGSDQEERLQALLDRIRDDDGTSYTYFTDIAELAELIRADLATLLAERFAVSGASPGPEVVGGRAVALPSAFTPLVGRDRELRAVVGLLEGDARLITLTGSGGIGKSRLAIEAAAQVRDRFPGGVVFVDLAPVTDPALVLGAIAEALGVRDGMGRIEDLLRTALHGRRILLLVDNFEQVIDGAPALRSLLQDAPLVTALVTSRILLRVSGEHAMEVGPLALPDLAAEPAVDVDAANPSIELFVSSVRAAKPDFRLTPQNLVAIRKICVALDGVPLAIELAAAHARVLAPADLLDRLHRRLAVLAGGGRDLPARQRTMRAAIEWSVQLLPPSAHDLLIRLGVFAGSFSLEAVEAIAEDLDGGEVLADLGTLVDGSLVRQEDRGDRARFTMLSTVNEYVQSELDARPDARAVRDRHAQWVVALADQAGSMLKGPDQGQWIEQLADDIENVRAGIRHLLNTGQWDLAAACVWSLYVYWWLTGHAEVRIWMDEVLDAGEPIEPRSRAIALYFRGTIGYWRGTEAVDVDGLIEGAELFHRSGDPTAEALTLGVMALTLPTASGFDRAEDLLATATALVREAGDGWGEAIMRIGLVRLAIATGRFELALERTALAVTIAERVGDSFGLGITLYYQGWARLTLGDAASAADDFDRALAVTCRIGHHEGTAYALEGLAAVAASVGEPERAGVLLGAAQTVRERTGLANQPTFHGPFVEALQEGPDRELFEAARLRGRSGAASSGSLIERLEARQGGEALPAERQAGRTLAVDEAVSRVRSSLERATS
jgi:predicted ATPase